jgi:hypothetical protein
MTPEAVLAQVLDAGGTVIWDWMTTLGRPGLRVPRSIVAEVEGTAPEVQSGIRQLLHRAGAFKRLVAQRGAEIPWMIPPGSPRPTSGHCISCGATLEDGSRCPACVFALELALGLRPRPQPHPHVTGAAR